jgi:hypothetical protein
MNTFILFVGLNDKDTKRQEIDTIAAYKTASRIILQHADGATITEANGIYTHADGNIVIEKTLKIEISGIDGEIAKSIATDLKVIFNQESILIQKIIATTEFI